MSGNGMIVGWLMAVAALAGMQARAQVAGSGVVAAAATEPATTVTTETEVTTETMRMPLEPPLAAAGGAEARGVTLLDLANPLDPALLAAAGIEVVYAPVAVPLARDADGRPGLGDEAKAAWQRASDLYAPRGIKLLAIGNFYSKPPEGAEQVDAWGRKHKIGCFRQPAFRQWLAEEVAHATAALEVYEAFGGFIFDDGAQVRVDCCYCDLCRSDFRTRHGIDAPPFEAAPAGTGRVPETEPRLLWDRFQRESFEIYLHDLRKAAEAARPGMLLLTIPSDSYFFGRYLASAQRPAESAMGAEALLQRIERLHVADWHIFRTFPLGRLPGEGERGLQPWAVGLHVTGDSPRMLAQVEGPYAMSNDRMRMLSAAELARMAAVTAVEGNVDSCWWGPAAVLPHAPTVWEGLAGVKKSRDAVAALLVQAEPEAAEVGVLYSTTSEVLEQAWSENTIERWRHLHCFEGVAYALTRAGVAWRPVMEDAIGSGALTELTALVVPNAAWIGEGAAGAIDTAARGGVKVVCVGAHPRLDLAVEAPSAGLIWYRWVGEGYRQEEYLERQRQALDGLLGLLPMPRERPRVTGEGVVAKNYRVAASGGGEGDTLVLAANWSLKAPAKARVEGSADVGAGTGAGVAAISDAITGEPIGPEFEIPPAGLRAVRIRR